MLIVIQATMSANVLPLLQLAHLQKRVTVVMEFVNAVLQAHALETLKVLIVTPPIMSVNVPHLSQNVHLPKLVTVEMESVSVAQLAAVPEMRKELIAIRLIMSVNAPHLSQLVHPLKPATRVMAFANVELQVLVLVNPQAHTATLQTTFVNARHR